MLEANEMKVLNYIVGKQKQIEYDANRLENPAVSNQLMSGWKGEEDNETNI